MRNLSRLLQEIKDNPIIYLDKPSITCLDLFLIGYLSTRTELGLDREGSGIEGFQEWMQNREKTNVSQSWARIILFLNGSERSSFFDFFRLFDIFCEQKSLYEEENEHKNQSIKNDFRYYLRELYEFLGSIKKRPAMYLGTPSITRLDMLLRGYTLARREAGLVPTEEEKEFEGFQSWVQEKYGIKSGQSWSKIILFYSVDEYEALNKFFELFEKYLNKNKSSEVDENSG
ncbi:MAG: hypothetical protein V7L25_01765 [Nostoc sp.]|uniref:hypothetical protein n=1 Tax=Nostoc sp. TaxID=1180 RepID=UPI002FEFE1C7